MKTPRTLPTKPIKYEIDINQVEPEFTRRVLGLMSVFYEPQRAEQYFDFPLVADVEAEEEPDLRKLTFDSPITDLRTKRFLDNFLNLDNAARDRHQQQTEELKRKLSKNKQLLNDVFSRNRTERPAVPRYIQAEQKYLANQKHLKESLLRATGLDYPKTVTSEKIRMAGIRGRERANERTTRVSNVRPGPDGRASPRRNSPEPPAKKLKYEPEGGYASYVRKSPVSKTLRNSYNNKPNTKGNNGQNENNAEPRYYDDVEY